MCSWYQLLVNATGLNGENSMLAIKIWKFRCLDLEWFVIRMIWDHSYQPLKNENSTCHPLLDVMDLKPARSKNFGSIQSALCFCEHLLHRKLFFSFFISNFYSVLVQCIKIRSETVELTHPSLAAKTLMDGFAFLELFNQPFSFKISCLDYSSFHLDIR